MNNEVHDNQDISYKSFEQWRVELFPDLVREEQKNIESIDTKKLGVSLANESFDNLIKVNSSLTKKSS